MGHKHKWQFAEFDDKLFLDDRTATFMCECGDVKLVEVRKIIVNKIKTNKFREKKE